MDSRVDSKVDSTMILGWYCPPFMRILGKINIFTFPPTEAYCPPLTDNHAHFYIYRLQDRCDIP